MITRFRHDNSAIYPRTHNALGQVQARRRRLGVLLIVIGVVWLGLSVTGYLDNMVMPIDYLYELAALGDRIVARAPVSAVLAGCGMLAASTFRRRR